MQKEKKIFLGVLLLVFILIMLFAFYLNSVKKQEEKPNEPGNTDEVIEKRFGLVDDYKEFFNIQLTLNHSGYTFMDESISVNEVYVNGISDTLYYFIKCTKFKELGYERNKYFLMILDKNTNYYRLSEINETINDLKLYARNYNIEEIKISSGNELKKASQSSQSILTCYMSYFKNMLIYDSYVAYEMLDATTKNKYIDYNDFAARNLEIYDLFSTKIFSYNLEESKNSKIYKFEDDNRNKITIYEESIMNFKISY